MIIGINSKNEIRQISEITDESLEAYEVDREAMFGAESNEMILCRTYNPENGYTGMADGRMNDWRMFSDENFKQTVVHENTLLKQQLEITQAVIDELLFGGVGQ